MSITSSTFLKEPSQRLAQHLPFYYGWIMLPIAMLAAIATSPGQTYGVSIFNESIRPALGLSHSQLTGTYMLRSLRQLQPLLKPVHRAAHPLSDCHTLGHATP